MPLTLDDVLYAMRNPYDAVVGTVDEMRRGLGNGRTSPVSVPVKEREVAVPAAGAVEMDRVKVRANELMKKKSLTAAEQLWLLDNGF